MKNESGFAHFDSNDRENFIAAVLLLAMEADPAVRELVAEHVRRAAGIDDVATVLAMGREARLEKNAEGWARVDLWLRFELPSASGHAFIEVKVQEGWDAAEVARQVRDQSARRLPGEKGPVKGSLLLAPAALCDAVRACDGTVQTISWARLMGELRALKSTSPVTKLAIEHLERTMAHAANLERPLTLESFELATTTTSCLRQFILDCIADIGCHVHGEPVWLTFPDGQPRREGGWAWHGLSVPHSRGGQRGRVGIYKYSEAPPSEQDALNTLWLEAYLGDPDVPFVAVKFAPPSLSGAELAKVRAELKRAWVAKGDGAT